VHLPGDIPGGRLQVKDCVQDELELASPRPENCVEPRGAAGEGVVRLVPDAEYGHYQSRSQGHRQNGDYGRKPVLRQALPRDEEYPACVLHAHLSIPPLGARLISPRSLTPPKCPRMLLSWLTRRSAAPFSAHIS